MTNLIVQLDSKNLLATLHFGDVAPKSIASIRLSLTSFSENIINIDNGLTIPFNELIHGLPNLAFIFKNEDIAVEFDEKAKKLIDAYIDDRIKSKSPDNNNFLIEESEITNILEESGFRRKLTKEQIRNLIKLMSIKHGANFSVPGAGKTTTLLALHIILKSKGIINKFFVISPINAFISWEDEIKEIFESGAFKVRRLRQDEIQKPKKTIDKSIDLLLVNYEKLRGDIKNLFPFFLENNVHLVLDESHRIKGGWNNLSYQQIIKLADVSKRRDILSGTPLPQGYHDLESQFYFLWRNNVLPEISNNNDETISSKINTSIANKFVRTTKKELGLKNPVIKYSYVQMGPYQAELYRLIKSEAARNISGMDQGSKEYFRSVGKSVVRLLQIATNPMLLGVENEYYDELLEIPVGSEVWDLLSEFAKYEKPSKIEYLREKISKILDRDPRNKIVIWSYFIRNILLLEQLLSGYNPVSIYGAVPTGNDQNEMFREGRIRKFHQDDSCRILIGNPHACGEGISLHKVCHFAIYLDRNFNAAFYLQSIDRIHRLGLDKSIDTSIDIIIAKNSIDEIVIKSLNKKTERMGKVLDDPYLQKLAYEPEDIPEDEILGLDSSDIQQIQDHFFMNDEH